MQSALRWVTTEEETIEEKGQNGTAEDRSPGEPGQVGTQMGDHLKRRQSKKKVKQHRARSAVGWVTDGKRDSRR